MGACGPLAAALRYAASLPCIAFGERRAVARRRRKREDNRRTSRCDFASLRLRASEVVREAMRGRLGA